MTREAKSLLDMPVISVDSGEQPGKVDELLFEPGQHVLYGMVLKPDEGGPLRFLRRERIHAVGQDAVTVASKAAAEDFKEDQQAREISFVGGHFTNMKVLTEDGNEIGKVDGVILNDDLTVASYHTSRGLLGLDTKEVRPDQVVSAGRTRSLLASPDSCHRSRQPGLRTLGPCGA